MTDKEAMAMALDALETEVSIDWTNNDEFNASAEKMHEAIAALKEVLKEHAMRETQRLGQEIEQKPCVHAKNPKGCYRVRCQVSDKCVDDEMSFRTTPPQPEQEPVAFASHGVINWIADKQFQHEADLYTTPPQRKPLTDEEMKKIWYALLNIMGWYSFQEIARAIEAAHDIKENT